MWPHINPHCKGSAFFLLAKVIIRISCSSTASHLCVGRAWGWPSGWADRTRSCSSMKRSFYVHPLRTALLKTLKPNLMVSTPSTANMVLKALNFSQLRWRRLIGSSSSAATTGGPPRRGRRRIEAGGGRCLWWCERCCCGVRMQIKERQKKLLGYLELDEISSTSTHRDKWPHKWPRNTGGSPEWW